MGPSPPRSAAVVLLGLLLLSDPVTAPASGPVWLPPRSDHPRTLADPREPRRELHVEHDGDRLGGVLGGPIPLVALPAGRSPVTVSLEVAAFFTLGREGAFFPLETFDGLFGLAAEGRRGRLRARLRAFHISAHKADGDSTVTYPGDTYSREEAELELGYDGGSWYTYGRLGAPWHAVPEDHGPSLALGAVRTPDVAPGPVLAVHLAADAVREWRLSSTFLAGWAWGSATRFRLLLRVHRGFRPEGQYADRRAEQWGLAIQFGPE